MEDPWDIAHICASLHFNHFSLHSKVIDCETSSSFAGNDELVAMEDSIDVGYVLYIIYDRLSHFKWNSDMNCLICWESALGQCKRYTP